MIKNNSNPPSTPTGSREHDSSKGAVQHYQTEAQGEGWEMAGANPESAGDCGRRNVQSASNGEAKEKILEAHGDKGHVCWGQLYAQTAKVRALHPPHWAPFQEGQRDAPGTSGHVSVGHFGREEEPAVLDVSFLPSLPDFLEHLLFSALLPFSSCLCKPRAFGFVLWFDMLKCNVSDTHTGTHLWE